MKAKILTLIGLSLFLNLFAQSKINKELQPKGMSLVPQGSFNMIVVDNKDTLNVSVSIEAFWMSNEITNSEYKEYVEFIRQHPDSLICWVDLENAKKDKVLYHTNDGMPINIKCIKYSEIINDIIDSTKFPYKDYFSNKKYDDYPVVGISQRQANFYCIWKTQMENTRLEKQGKPFAHDYRLPTEAEWAYVASKAMINKKLSVTDNDVINPSISGNVNDWGLYNLTGNVSEWTASCHQNKCSKVDTIAINRDLKIVRGGSWKTNSNADERNVLDQNTKEDYIGFRIVRSYIGEKK